jgi:glycosyltransferase involved in cell wall biosynthesis
MEVLAHEGALLSAAGHEVEQYTLAATDTLGLSPIEAGAKAVWNRSAARDVGRVITAFRPDVVHVHTPFPLMSPAVFRVARRHGLPVVTTLHSYRYSCIAGTCWRDGHVCEDCVGSKTKLPGVRHRCYHDSLGASTALTLSLGLHRAMGTFHRDVTRYLALTPFSRRLLIRDGFPADRISVKPNSVFDPGLRAGPRSEERLILFAGRLIDIKGVATLLAAWTGVPGGATLVIAGDGPLRSAVEDRAAHDTSVRYLGWVDEAHVTALMASAELVVVPSEWYEGQPLVILRSLSLGTPVLVSDLENLSEDVEHDRAGWSFEVKNPLSLRQHLTRAINDPAWVAGMRSAARRSYERRYSPQVDLGRLEEIYRAVMTEVER